MDHEYYKDRLSAYHDLELTPEEMHMMQEHVAGCEECQAKLAELAKLDRLVAEQSELAGEEYWEQAARKIEQRLGRPTEEAAKVTDIKRSSRGLWWKWAAVAASVAFLTFVGLHRFDILDRPVSETEAPSVFAPKIDSPKEAPDPGRATVETARKGKRNLDAVREEMTVEPSGDQAVVVQSREELLVDLAAETGATDAVSDPAEQGAGAVSEPAEDRPAPAPDKDISKVPSLAIDKAEVQEKVMRAPSKPLAADQLSQAEALDELQESGLGDGALYTAQGKRGVDGFRPAAASSERLTRLRVLRDSLMALFSADESLVLSMEAAGEPPEASQSLELQRELLEVWRELAAAGDSVDVAGARAFFEDYVERPGAELKDEAREYLRQLPGSDR